MPESTSSPVNLSKKNIALFITLICCFILFFLGGPDEYSSRSFNHFWNLGHLFFFAVFTMMLVRQTPFISKARKIIQYAYPLSITLILGIIIELIQFGFNRTPDTGDVIRNLIGCCIGLCFLVPTAKLKSNPAQRLFQLLCVILTLIQVYPCAVSFIDERIAARQFPVLADFETPFEPERWMGFSRFERSKETAGGGNYSLKIALSNNATYSGLFLTYFPSDWQGFQTWHFSVFNPDEADLKLTVRAHDVSHPDNGFHFDDRYNKRMMFKEGWTHVAIPLSDLGNAPETRKMDLSHMINVGLFATRLKEPRTFFLDNVYLSPSRGTESPHNRAERQN